jgi:hypothetical protein
LDPSGSIAKRLPGLEISRLFDHTIRELSGDQLGDQSKDFEFVMFVGFDPSEPMTKMSPPLLRFR